MRATVDLGGAVATGGLSVTEVNGPDVGATNSFAEPRRVDARERRVERGGGGSTTSSPPIPITVMRFAVTS